MYIYTLIHPPSIHTPPPRPRGRSCLAFGLPRPPRKPHQRLPINPHAHPLIHHRRPHGLPLIELDAWPVPLQDTPLQPASLHLHYFPRQLRQQEPRIPLPPLGLPDEQVLEVDPRRGAPGAVVVEIERQAGDGLLRRDQQQAARGPRRGRGLAGEGDGLGEEGGRGLHVGEGVFVLGQLADQFEDRGDVWWLQCGVSWGVFFAKEEQRLFGLE